MGVILIAYERESEQAALDQLLAARGHQVVRAANGLSALDAARREPPQLIVSDIVLPRMDGFALCRKWKQDERLQSIPFIFYTRRHDDPKYERFALELGAERFLARAVQPEALLKAVDELLPSAPNVAPASAAASAFDSTATQRLRAQERAYSQTQQALEQAQAAQYQLRSQLSDLVAANSRLAAGEMRFRRVFEANPLPMWITDRATDGFIAVNDAALAVYGYDRAEFLALSKSALQSQPDGTVRPLDEATSAHRRKNGAALLMALTSREIEFDGRTADLVAAYDLTERFAEWERRLQQAASQRTLLEGMIDGCWILNGEGRIVAVNSAYCRMSGYASTALLNMPAAELEQDASENTARLHPDHASGGTTYQARHRRNDGSMLEVEVSVGTLPDNSGMVLAMIRDVSAQRREQIQQRVSRQQLEFLVDLARQAESFDESAIVRRVVEQASAITDSPLAYLFFVDTEQKTLSLAAWRDRQQGSTHLANVEPRPLSRAGLFTECVRGRHPTASNDLAWKQQTCGLPDLQRYLAVPLVSGNDTVAVLGIANRESNYTEDDQQSLAALADGVWRVLQGKRAHAQTLGSLQRADVALQGMIDALVKMGEQHDPHTAGSARRVAALAVALAREAGLDGERQHALRVAALLHDVGNVAVPATVLSKPHALHAAEVALVRTHVEAGVQLLADIDFGAPVASIVHQHHERCDGSGYPLGLKGDAISMEARILAIADTVEAMCSTRSHRAALGMDAALDEINHGAGKIYDLHLAAACTRLIRQHGFVLPR